MSTLATCATLSGLVMSVPAILMVSRCHVSHDNTPKVADTFMNNFVLKTTRT